MPATVKRHTATTAERQRGGSGAPRPAGLPETVGKQHWLGTLTENLDVVSANNVLSHLYSSRGMRGESKHPRGLPLQLLR